jgi:hypothetical protein
MCIYITGSFNHKEGRSLKEGHPTGFFALGNPRAVEPNNFLTYPWRSLERESPITKANQQTDSLASYDQYVQKSVFVIYSFGILDMISENGGKKHRSFALPVELLPTSLVALTLSRL